MGKAKLVLQYWPFDKQHLASNFSLKTPLWHLLIVK